MSKDEEVIGSEEWVLFLRERKPGKIFASGVELSYLSNLLCHLRVESSGLAMHESYLRVIEFIRNSKFGEDRLIYASPSTFFWKSHGLEIAP